MDKEPNPAGNFREQAPSAAQDNPVPIAIAAAFVAGVVIGRASRR